MSTLKKILSVEDEADIREIIQLALELVGGYQVQICSSGQDAVAKAESFLPDLLLLDVMMPNMDGPTTLANLRKIPGLAHIPAVFMTAKAQVSEINELRNYGASAVITKPFDPMTLASQLQQIWEIHDV